MVHIQVCSIYSIFDCTEFLCYSPNFLSTELFSAYSLLEVRDKSNLGYIDPTTFVTDCCSRCSCLCASSFNGKETLAALEV